MVKRILKRNQVMITALALMLAVAGYLHFAGEKVEDDSIVMNNTYTDEYTLEISDEDAEASNLLEVESLDAESTLTEDYLDVSLEDVLETQDSEVVNTNENTVVEDVPGEAVFTSTVTTNTFSGAKLLKEQTRAKNKEMLLEIINNVNIDESQKTQAIDNMISLTDIAEKETAAEILLDAKGFGDCVVSISEESVDVFVYANELSESERAQIEDIVKRKTDASADKIVITAVDVE